MVLQSCELLSFCIFEILNTVNKFELLKHQELWIAFILYLWNIEHSGKTVNKSFWTVVNCFHFVSLKYWTQYNMHNAHYICGCELLSFCIFEILNTVSWTSPSNKCPLWIAFILYLWNIEHSCLYILYHPKVVVNCFHFVSLKYWTQLDLLPKS